MSRITVLYLFVVVLFGGLSNSTQAQVTRAKETYTSLDGTIRFEYPAGWAVEEISETGNITLATSRDVLERNKGTQQPVLFNNELAVFITVQPIASSFTLSTIRIAIEQALPDFDLRDTILAGRPALIATGEIAPQDGERGLTGEMIFTVVSFDSDIAVVVGAARPGQLAPFETTIYEIAESLRIDRTAIKENVPFASAFEPDDPTNSHWSQDSRDAVRQSEIADGLYKLTLNEAQAAMTPIVKNGSLYDDSQITMRVLIDHQALEGVRSYGIIFRFVDASNYYLFEIYSSGSYGLWKAEQGEWKSLLEDAMLVPSAAIAPIDDAITVQVIAQGETITGLVNGEELVSLLDSSFQSGGVGIYFVSNVEGAVLSVDSYSVEAITE